MPRRRQDLVTAPGLAKKLAQHGASSGPSAKKLALQAVKRPFWAIFPALGELFRARTHARPSRAKNFAHSAHKHGDDETDDTTARPQQGTAETGSTSAPKNCTKTPISRPQRRRRFQFHTGTSEQRSSRFQTTDPPRLQHPDTVLVTGDDTASTQIPHVIYRGHFSRHLINVEIPTMQIQCLNEAWRNYVRSC